ncbi:MAG: hypothetical protein E7266_00535 [Lachnospiraceae bacterium]|nr:hypothetical protein [Lachnospiraceae bacterium]
MKFLFKHYDDVMTEIDVDYRKETVSIKNYTDNVMFKAFGVVNEPTFSDFEDLLSSRCFPKERDGMKIHLQELGLDYYDELAIIEKTKGCLDDDHFSLERIL